MSSARISGVESEPYAGIDEAGANTVASGYTVQVDPEAEMAAIYRNQLANFRNNREPLIDALEASIDDKSISERGQVEASRLSDRSQDMAKRIDSGRANSLLPSQQASKTQNINRAAALGASSITTSSKRIERSNRVATRQQLMGIAEQLSNTGTASMAQAAETKRIREAQNEAASKSSSSQIGGMIGTVAGAYFGGPAGATVGGAIGGYVGGSI